MHLLGCPYRNRIRKTKVAWTGDEDDVRFAATSCLCDRVAHLTGRAVTDVTNWINVFNGRACSDQNLPAFKIPRTFQKCEDVLNDIFDGRQPSRAICAARHLTDLGI